MRVRFTGLAAWWRQHASAVCMLLFLVFALAIISVYPRHSYLEWRALSSSPGVSMAILAFFAALLLHM